MITLNIKRIIIIAVAVYIITKFFIFGVIPILFVGAAAYYAIAKWGTVNGNTSN